MFLHISFDRFDKLTDSEGGLTNGECLLISLLSLSHDNVGFQSCVSKLQAFKVYWELGVNAWRCVDIACKQTLYGNRCHFDSCHCILTSTASTHFDIEDMQHAH